MLLELLAAAQAVDPTTLPLWAVVVLAAGMYPLGIMLGAPCSPCCNCGCPVGEQLPDAVKVSFSGLTKSAIFGRDLVTLSITSCFGSGATAKVTAAGDGVLTPGPISAVSLTSPGTGYAVLGRVIPTGLSITGGSGTGAEYQITLAETVDDCDRPAWEISNVKVTKAGVGYANTDQLFVSLGSDEYEDQAAALYLETTASEPTLSATASSFAGTGATFSVTTKLVNQLPPRWGVDQITVEDGGSGYQDGDPVTVTPAEGEVEVEPALAGVQVFRVEPEVYVLNQSGIGGGAQFLISLNETTYAGRPVWEIDTVTVTSPGSGYQNGLFLMIAEQLGTMSDDLSYWQIQTGAGGAITGLTKISAGRYWKPTGVVEGVQVSVPGTYYAVTGPLAVNVVGGGRYYKTSLSESAIVADVTVTLSQLPPSDGSGAAIQAVIDGDPTSPTFSQITGLTITSGGNGYMAEGYLVTENCCVTSWNGVTVLAERISPTSCDYQVDCCARGSVYVRYNGHQTPPTVKIGGSCGVDFDVTTEPEFSCDAISFAAEDVFGTGTATVEAALAGDTGDTYHCPSCCISQTGGIEEATEAGEQCTQEACLSAGYVWQERCDCGPCNDCPQEQSLVVAVQSTGYLPVAGGGFTQVTKSYTLTLSAANNWSAATPDFNYMPGQINAGAAASVAFGGDELTACAVYVVAHGNDPNQPTSAVPGFCWDGNLVGWPQPAGVRIPAAHGCFTDGASLNCQQSPTGSASITVTLVTP